MFKKLGAAFVVIIVVGVAFYLWQGNDTGQDAGKGQQVNTGQQQSMPAFKAMKVQWQDATRMMQLPGRMTASKIAEIRPQVSGIILERLFVEGSEVKEGQQLYQIDPIQYQVAYDSAQAHVQKAEANVTSITARNKRYEALVKIDAVSKQEFDDIQASVAQAKAEVAIAKAALEQAKINLAYTKVYAPISGRIGKSDVTKGALVTANQSQPLATITVLDPIYADIRQPGSEFLQLQEMVHAIPDEQEYQDVPVTLFLGEKSQEAYPHQGQLQFHEVKVEETTGSVQLRALFPNPEHLLLPGLFVRTQIPFTQSKNMLVPQNATIRQEDGSLAVWVVDSNQTAQLRPVTVEGSLETNWMITEGLEEGEVILLEGLIKIQPGMKVQPLLTQASSVSDHPQHKSGE